MDCLCPINAEFFRAPTTDEFLPAFDNNIRILTNIGIIDYIDEVVSVVEVSSGTPSPSGSPSDSQGTSDIQDLTETPDTLSELDPARPRKRGSSTVASSTVKEQNTKDADGLQFGAIALDDFVKDVTQLRHYRHGQQRW